ncbi:MAG TPA: MarR family winged helix-turn-helix transcriptional regulator [Thermomicrobiales bacterium]|nr:MarR family winged helix-turn-helix transcriptional regulator [Thermomicrobiales bacterium]
MDQSPDITNADLQALAEFRYQIRHFLSFSERAARAAGIEPRQHQLLLALAGLPEGVQPTIRALADRMHLQHHSAVELVSRLEQRGMVVRDRDRHDRRQVLVRLTPEGEAILRQLSTTHWAELRSRGPILARALNAIVTADNSFRPSPIPEDSLAARDN